MWRLGRAVTALGATPRSLRFRLQTLAAEATEAPKLRPRPAARRKEMVTAGRVLGAAVGGAGVAYAASDSVRSPVDAAVKKLTEAFEDFNDTSREFFENTGDRLLGKRQEPWLLDRQTMKYDEMLPTLVLDLDKVILHLHHESKQGWQVVKRPFADQFFKEICHYYELVIFSDDVFPVALDIVSKWNLPISGVLHRDFCKKKRNHFVKDLSKLGRRLDRTLMIDHDPAAFQLQPANGIVIRPFDGDTSDTELADLLEFLKAAACSPTDLRKFVEKYGGGDQDVGRRYLLQKQEQDKLVESRRSLGRAFGKNPAIGAPPGQFGGFGNMR
ncbi:TIM50 [Symbiodinium sp. CCMP2592]|nr:TIM50 [Symbiodinium sp. CCMP2592]